MDIIKKYLPEIGAVLVIVGLIIWGTVQTLRLEASRNETQKAILEHEQYKADQTAMLLHEQQRLTAIINEVGHEKDAEIEALQQHNAAVTANNSRLQNDRARTDAYIYSRTADNCQAAVAAYHVYADMFTEAAGFAGEVAPYADQSHIAGIVCERSYNSIIEVLK